MANILKYCITQSDAATSFTTKETTGVYAVITNEGGWGAPNYTIASVTAATMTLEQLTDVATNEYTTPVAVSVYPTLPNTTSTLKLLTAEDFGYGVDAQFPDAVYKLTYTVTSSSGAIAPVTIYKGFYAIIDCKIKQLADRVSICTCNCGNLEQQLKDAKFWRGLLKSADDCGNIPAIMKFIEKLNHLLTDCNCD